MKTGPDSDVANVKRIACVGEVMLELSAPATGDIQLGVAGDTYNTAVYLKRLLGDAVAVDYVTALGTDSFSDRILAELQRHGLGCSAIERRGDRSPGLYAISTTEEGERSFTYWRSESAARTLFLSPCEVGFAQLRGYDLVYLSGITLAVLPPAIRGQLAIEISQYRQAGGLFVYDSNHRPRLWGDPEVSRETNERFWGLADIALPSVDDEMLIYGDPDEVAVTSRLHKFGVTFGALKRGELGPLDLSGQTENGNYPRAAKVVDTTAAGDSFNAGFLAGLVKGGTTADALMSGHELASKVVGHRGAITEV